MSFIEWIEFPPLGDARGSLVALEGQKTVPFTIRRVYYLFGTKAGVSRGFMRIGIYRRLQFASQEAAE